MAKAKRKVTGKAKRMKHTSSGGGANWAKKTADAVRAVGETAARLAWINAQLPKVPRLQETSFAPKFPATPGRTGTREKKRKKDFVQDYGSGYLRKPFPKGKKPKSNFHLQALKYGYATADEYWGSCSDSHAVIMQFSTFNIGKVRYAIAGAILRKLFSKAGISFGKQEQEMPLTNFADSSNWKIEWTLRNDVTSAFAGNFYNIPDNTTFWAMVINSGIGNEIQDMLRDPQTFKFWEFRLYCNCDADNAQPRLMASLQADEMYLEVDVKGVLKLQNKSKGVDAGTNYDTERVDNQPVYGYRYEFSNANPIVRGGALYSETAGIFNASAENSVSLANATTLNALNTATNYDEPPNAKEFTNCVKVARVSLNPGDIKSTNLSWHTKGKLNTVLYRMAAKLNTLSLCHRAAGKCVMFYFEEVLRTTSGNPIIVGYEWDYKSAAIITTKKQAVPLHIKVDNLNING